MNEKEKQKKKNRIYKHEQNSFYKRIYSVHSTENDRFQNNMKLSVNVRMQAHKKRKEKQCCPLYRR